MTLTATELYDRLIELDSGSSGPFALADNATESDVVTWLDSKDVSKLETAADDEISRTAITDLQADVGIGDDNLCVCGVIESHNDNPDNYEAAYVIRADRTIVQYKKRGVGGNQPIAEADVQAELDAHVAEMVNRAVNAELLKRAKTEFGT
jgi:hypothetical protein